MKINKIAALALMALVLIVLNVFFFLWTDEKARGPVEWMSYGFAAFAFVAACVSILLIREDSDEVYDFTTPLLSISYFAVQLVLSVAAIFCGMILRGATQIAGTIAEKMTGTVAQQPSPVSKYYVVLVLSVYLVVLVFYALSVGIHSMANKATAEALAGQRNNM